jgi:phosphosulfolactate synthase
MQEFLGLPSRPGKPRDRGWTHVIDKGLTLPEVGGILDLAGDYIDIVKLGWGTSYVTPNLAEKLRLYRDAGIPIVCGGTLLEAAIARNRLDEFRRWTSEQGFTHIEVSDGTIDLERGRKVELIESLAKDFVVLSEVGTKDSERIYAPYQWVAWIKEELEAGAFMVITEARESGTSGIYRQTGEVRSGLIDEIVHEVPINKLLFEAPQKEQQAWFIKHFGADVNLGNIAPAEVIPLETLRLGLRSDTMIDLLLRDLPHV